MPQRDHLTSDALRFAIAGTLNTGLTTLAYLGGLYLVPPTISYTAAWLVGIAAVMALYPDWVYVGGDRSFSGRLALGVSTVLVYVIGLAVLAYLIRQGIGPRASFFITLVCTTIINFFAGRALARRA